MLTFLWLAVYIPTLFRPALLDDADTVHAEAAREMLLRNDWVTLYANGVRYLEKAPLMYWAVAEDYRLFGISEWSTRLPLSLGVLILVLTVYRLGSRLYGRQGGFFSALILVTAFGPFIFTRFLIPDILVALWLTLGFEFFLLAYEQLAPAKWACWGLAAATALDVLTKGLIGIVFPIAIIGTFLLLVRNLRFLGKMHLVSSSLVFLVIAAPWHWLAAVRNPGAGQAPGGWLWFYFVNEHFKRYLGTRYPHDYDTVPFLAFWGLLLVWLLPWSTFLYQGLREVPHKFRTYAGELDARGRANLLFAVWAAFIMVFFSFSTRQEYYVLPALPALALLTGGWLARESEEEAGGAMRRSGRLASAAVFVVGAAGFAIAMFLLWHSNAPAPGTDISDLLENNPEKYALSFGHFFDLTPQALGAFRPQLLGAGFGLLLGTGLNWWLRRRNRPAGGNLALAAMMVVLLLCSHAAFAKFEPVESSRHLARVVMQEFKAGDVIVINGEYEKGSTMNFYTGVQGRTLSGRNANLWYGSLFPDAPAIFDDDASFARLWAGPQRVFLWTPEERKPNIPLSNVYEIARRGGKVVLSNQPSRVSAGPQAR